MPKSKKPRHKHRPKVMISIRGVPQTEVNKIKEAFTDIEFKVEVNLPAGTCTKLDMDHIIEIFNLTGLSISWRKDLDKQAVEEFTEEFNVAMQALANIRKRGAETQHYVATGDELKAIRTAVVTVGAYLRECMELQPVRLLREWSALNYYGDL